jgi:D-threo-aldose 1-dehydrogenase
VPEPYATRRLGRAGLDLTVAGFGGSQIGNLFSPVSDAVAGEVLDSAWRGGVRYFDTAPGYGNGLSETRLGEAMRGWPRDEFVVSTKVGYTLSPGQPEPDEMWVDPAPNRVTVDYSYDGTLRQLESSLARLDTDRVEIALIHDLELVEFAAGDGTLLDVAMRGAYRALVELRDQGVVSAIGIGVNEVDVCLAAAEQGDFDCFLLAGRYTLLEQGALDGLFPLCERRGIGVLLGGVFNSGILARGNRGDARYRYEPPADEVTSRVGAIERLCEQFDVPLGAAAVQFSLAHPAVASAVLGARGPEQQLRNLEFVRCEIPAELWTSLTDHGLIRADAPIPA